MRHDSLYLLAASAMLAACGTSQARVAEPARHAGLQIKHTSVFVDDQDKALHFYADVLGLAKKDDVNKGGYRWLTVAAAGDATGTELQLALDTSPGAKAFQQALLDSHQPAVMFYTDDVKSDFERIKAHGGDFTMTPTSVTGATIAQLKDNCGNLVQLTQLVR